MAGLSSVELQEHLDEQIGFLETSADLYDQGRLSEAKRLALTLRVLLHQTPSSHSLLDQLGIKQSLLFPDASNYEAYNTSPWDVAIYVGLIGQVMIVKDDLVKNIKYAPILDNGHSPPTLIDFDTWWNMIVIKDERGKVFSRRDLVLALANKDGGGHVDPKIGGKYRDLSRNNSLGLHMSIGRQAWTPIPHPERPAVRQIAHEVLQSLKSGYTKKNDFGEISLFISNLLLCFEPLQFDEQGDCPCESGEKYKDCHGA